MDMLEAIVKVLAVGLVLGAGLPALFALGLRFHTQGAGEVGADGVVTAAPNPILRGLGFALYAIVVAAIVVGLLWLTKQTILYYTHIQLFPKSTYSS